MSNWWSTYVVPMFEYVAKWYPLSKEVQMKRAETDILKEKNRHEEQMKTLEIEELKVLAHHFEAEQMRKQQENDKIRQQEAYENEKRRQHEITLRQLQPLRGLTAEITKHLSTRFSSVCYHQNTAQAPFFVPSRSQAPNSENALKFAVVPDNISFPELDGFNDKRIR